mgnify:CR=1 FL=1
MKKYQMQIWIEMFELRFNLLLNFHDDILQIADDKNSFIGKERWSNSFGITTNFKTASIYNGLLKIPT